jgi:hypothetical protein
MCLIIDTCCLALVFDGKSKKHSKFIPVLKWINDTGRMIYGGTKYNTELGKAAKFLPYVTELARKRRVVQIPTSKVDAIAAALKLQITDPDFDDEHLVALVILSRCRVVCTDDNIAISYLKRSDLFPHGVSRPKIYRGHKSHDKLCCDQHVVGACLE